MLILYNQLKPKGNDTKTNNDGDLDVFTATDDCLIVC